LKKYIILLSSQSLAQQLLFSEDFTDSPDTLQQRWLPSVDLRGDADLF
jgi:hypothetical protein